MKNILFTVLTFISFNILAQVPQGVGYQGVATDSEGIELVNQSISIKASILSGSANGTIEWEETHSTSTDTFGLFNLTIGQGTNTGNGVQANFADISWGTNTHFLKIEMDATGGNDFSFMGTNQMMSVPYALYAESANINYDSISNLLSADSTFITNVGGEMGGGGCDFNWPIGISGQPIIHDLLSGDYIVPSGKNLYITHSIYSQHNATITVNGYEIIKPLESPTFPKNKPLILKEGDIVSHVTTSGTPTFINLSGLLSDINLQVTPIVQDITSNTYVVPTGKHLIITHALYKSSNAFLTVNGNEIALPSESPSFPTLEPLVTKGGDIISYSSPGGSPNYVHFSGYLVDENYFEGCGGGGGNNSGEGGSSTNDDGYGDFTDNSQYNGFRFFFIEDNRKLFESDSLSSFKNLLYTEPSGNSNGKIKFLFTDEVNQELYYLESPAEWSPATMVKKTSLANFNPQTIYVAPFKFQDIEDFTVNTSTGGLFFAIGGNSNASNQGVYKFENNTFSSLTSGSSVQSICIGSGGNVYYGNGGTIYDMQNNVVFTHPGSYSRYLSYDATINTFFVVDQDKIYDDQGNLIYQTPYQTGSLQDMTINTTTQKIMISLSAMAATMDYDGGNYTPVYVSNQSINSISIFPSGNITNTNTSIVSFLPSLNFYFVEDSRKLYETDILSPSNLLYTEPSGNSNGKIKFLFTDEVNQELYYLESPADWSPATMVKKTSLANFNPQTIYVAPFKIQDIEDFTVNTSTGGLFFAIGGNSNASNQGVYKFENNTFSSLTSGSSVQSICIGSGGNVYYGNGGTIYDMQNNVVFTHPGSYSRYLSYDATINTFFVVDQDKIYDDQGNLIYQTPYQTGSLQDMTINTTTQKIMISLSAMAATMDYDGGNYTPVYVNNQSINSLSFK